MRLQLNLVLAAAATLGLAACGSGSGREARVFGVGTTCLPFQSTCRGGIAGSVSARNASGRAVATQRLVKSRYSFLLPPGRYALVLRFQKDGSLTNQVVARSGRSTRSNFFISVP